MTLPHGLAAAIFLLASAAALGVALVLVLRRNHVRSTNALVSLLGINAIWLGSYAASLLVSDSTVQDSLIDVTTVCSIAAATALVHFVGLALHVDRWLTGPATATVVLVDAALALLFIANPHGLFTQPSVVASAAGADPGAGYWSALAWVALHLVIVTAILLRNRRGNGMDRRLPQALTLSAAIIWVAAVLRIAHVSLFGLDPVALGMLAGTLISTVAALNDRTIALESIAHAEFLRHLEDGVVVLDADDAVAAINTSAAVRLGVPEVGSLRRPLLEVVGDARSWRDCIAGRATSVEVRTANGGARHLRTERMPLRDPRGRAMGTAFLIRDVTEGHQDPLTGVGNRRCFADSAADVVDAALAGGRPVCVAAIDLDNLKRVNDQHGHFAGDAALVAAASSIRSAIRIGDRVVRLGGDEFVAVLVDSNLAQAQVIAERMRRAVERLGNGTTISVGLAQVASDGGLPRGLARADGALYEAKRDGRNRVVTAQA